MKFTLADCTERINQILNYPSVHYTDISHFFDQAISEINTSLKLGIKPISYLAKYHTFNINEHPNIILLDSQPTSATKISIVHEKPTETPNEIGYSYCYDVVSGKYYLYTKDTWTEFVKLYAFYNAYDTAEEFAYSSVVLSDEIVVWGRIETNQLTEFNLLDFLPMDWIILFLIPYVCFKFSLRDGGSGNLYSDEFTQGFQQLQTSYSIPCFVNLKQHVHLLAYIEDVKDSLNNATLWNTKVPTRAIYDSYKVDMIANSPSEPFNFNSGGWGI